MEPLPVDEFVACLKEGSNTSQWDVVVSYDEKCLTDLLVNLWKNKKVFGAMNVHDIPGTETIKEDGKRKVVKFNMNCTLAASNPKLDFDPAQQGRVNLAMDLAGTYQRVYADGPEKTTWKIPTGCYRLNINSPIGSITGKSKDKPTVSSRSSRCKTTA